MALLQFDRLCKHAAASLIALVCCACAHQSARVKVADTVTAASAAATDAVAAVDIRGTLTNMLAAVEDVAHQLAEHKRVLEVTFHFVTHARPAA